MKIFLALLLCCLFTDLSGQNKYWQQQNNFTITVSLNDSNNSLDGFESIEYINNSPDTLTFIWFHIWPNAYKNDRTAFSEQLLENGRTDFYFSPAKDKGYINRLNFEVNGQKAEVENVADIDIIKLQLPTPLAPSNKAIITTPFHVQLPLYFSRGGHIGNQYQVTQWFPKPAVYDHEGWHAMPYLDQGEFYSEFGNFDVQITLPTAYTVAATGVLQDDAMLQELKLKGRFLGAQPLTTWHYKQQQVHDFAWFASKEFTAHYDTAKLSSGKVIDVFSYYKKEEESWKKSITYIKDGLRFYSDHLGDYPYETVSAISGPNNVSSGGMEYPTITLITTSEGGRELDATLVHEVGHNWFYGALASNERKHPWMDEGMNTYYQLRYEAAKYGLQSGAQNAAGSLAKKLPNNEEEMLLHTMEKNEKDEPIDKASNGYSPVNYELSVYVKGAGWMKLLEQKLGTALFDRAMKQYYSTWKARHPYPNDFQQTIEAATGQNLEAQFALLNRKGNLNEASTARPFKLSFLFNLNNTKKYNYINIAPVIGYNNYDRLMAGLLVHNYQLPLNKVNFIASGVLATRSKKFNSFGRISHNITHKKYDVETALSLLNFTQNDFLLSNGTNLFPRFRRIVPSVKLTLYPADVNYNKQFTIQFKSFLLKEDELDFKTIITPTDTTEVISLLPKNNTINRLSLNYKNSRTLYPYSINLTNDQGKNFIRSALTAKYFFNYADNKSGLSARFFAGKFFYLKSKTISNRIDADRYALNLTAPKGNEDYTYSNYFIGRNEFDGYMSQQIMERDGFFKVRTDLLSDKIGKSDDWLMSINLVTDLPNSINPLQALPIKIPLKVFVDVGTYAGAFKSNPSTGRFLYDAGLQIALFKSLVNIYIPVLYSKVYGDYFKSTIPEKRFLKNISFSIDIQQLSIKSILPGIPL